MFEGQLYRLPMLLIIFIVLILSLLLIELYKYNYKLKDELFYDVSDVYPCLKKIHKLRGGIMDELNNIRNVDKIWNDWPERELYNSNGKWKIFPFYAFGIWIEENCNKMPTLTKFIKNIPNLKIAILSKLSPGMKLIPHKGWGKHSNNVLRAHYGLIVPDNKCYVMVLDNKRKEKRYHKNDEWLIFDDSKTHMAENTSNEDRIVLILDIKRPDNVKKGVSKIGDTKELLELVNYFKNKNINLNLENESQ